MTIVDLKKYIYENQKIEYILSEIGCGNIKYHEKAKRPFYSASNKDGDNPSAINVYENEYLKCINWTREKEFPDNSDLITLVHYNMRIDNPKTTFGSAVKFIHKILGLNYEYSPIQKPEKEKYDPLAIFKKASVKKRVCNVLDFEPMDENVLNDFTPLLFIDWFRDGIMPWTAKKFKLGYSYRWKRVIIPYYHWLTGKLMGYNARTTVENYDLFGIKKYFLTPGMNKSISLYGLWEHMKDIESCKYVTIFEAERSVLKRDSLLDYSGVALGGHSVSDEQVRIILGLNINEVVIALDKDICIEEVRMICERFYRVKKVSYIYDKWGLLGDKDSPADAMNKIYNFLFKHRVVYDESEHKKYIKSLEKR